MEEDFPALPGLCVCARALRGGLAVLGRCMVNLLTPHGGVWMMAGAPGGGGQAANNSLMTGGAGAPGRRQSRMVNDARPCARVFPCPALP